MSEGQKGLHKDLKTLKSNQNILFLHKKHSLLATSIQKLK